MSEPKIGGFCLGLDNERAFALADLVPRVDLAYRSPCNLHRLLRRILFLDDKDGLRVMVQRR